MARAGEYLHRGWTIKAAAYSVGYTNYENFLKAFKKTTGKTPLSFRTKKSAVSRHSGEPREAMSEFSGD